MPRLGLVRLAWIVVCREETSFGCSTLLHVVSLFWCILLKVVVVVQHRSSCFALCFVGCFSFFAVVARLDRLVLGYLRLISGVEGCFVCLHCFRMSQSVKWCSKLSEMYLVVVDGYRLF